MYLGSLSEDQQIGWRALSNKVLVGFFLVVGYKTIGFSLSSVGKALRNFHEHICWDV